MKKYASLAETHAGMAVVLFFHTHLRWLLGRYMLLKTSLLFLAFVCWSSLPLADHVTYELGS
jgi:hypothetical protein